MDDAGRLYVASNAGVEVISDKGENLGAIPIPKKPQNLAFAGPDKKTLWWWTAAPPTSSTCRRQASRGDSSRWANFSSFAHRIDTVAR